MSNNPNRTVPPDAVTEPLVKVVLVPVPQTRAFELFTDEISSWWPLPTHSVGRADAASVRIDGTVGGEIVETISDGSTTVWGTVTAWEPPDLVTFTWHPGGDPARATQVSVTFTQASDGTRVELTHTGWQALEHGIAMRENYDGGWEFVLGHYTAIAG